MADEFRLEAVTISRPPAGGDSILYDHHREVVLDGGVPSA